jgi:hypothetical protein
VYDTQVAFALQTIGPLDSILKKATLAAISIGPWVAVVILAFAVSSSHGFALDAQPDLGVSVVGAGSDIRPITAPGQPFLFTIGLDNMNGDADAHHVKLSAVLPNGLAFQSSEPPPTRVESGNRPVWEIDTLPAKALPRLFQVTAETDTNLAPGRQLEISAAVESSESNATSADNHASYTIYVQKVGPALVFVGSTLDSVLVTADGPTTFNVNLMNAGNLLATDTRLEATLPTGIKLDKADPQPASSSSQVITFELGDLARAESKSVSMTVEVDHRQLSDLLSNDRPSTFVFRASRMASGTEVTDSHFEISKHIESAGQDVAVWLMTEGAREPGEASPNDDVTCVIRFANLGNEPAHAVVVALYLASGLAIAHSDPQPAGTGTNDAFAGGVAHWDVDDLGVGMSRTVRSVIHATAIPDEGALVTATITADGFDIDSTNNTASLLWHRPTPPGTLKSAWHSAAVVKQVGVLILVMVAVLIVFRQWADRGESMSDFFNALKQGLGRGVTTVGIKSKEMLDSNRVSSQIPDFEKQKKEALAQLGASVCTMLDGGHIDEEVLRTARVAIGRIDRQISEQREELARIHTEAQQALGAVQQTTATQQAPGGDGAPHCASCGVALVPGAKFCGGCGVKVA